MRLQYLILIRKEKKGKEERIKAEFWSDFMTIRLPLMKLNISMIIFTIITIINDIILEKKKMIVYDKMKVILPDRALHTHRQYFYYQVVASKHPLYYSSHGNIYLPQCLATLSYIYIYVQTHIFFISTCTKKQYTCALYRKYMIIKFNLTIIKIVNKIIAWKLWFTCSYVLLFVSIFINYVHEWKTGIHYVI